MSIAEPMACGVPCVAFENDGPCEIISNGVDGYLIPKFDIQRFADVLIACIEKKENYDAMCTKAVEKAKKFNLSGIVSQFIDIMKGNELK
jgi:glycosyltransferase involved in cell wall biosynthesis